MTSTEIVAKGRAFASELATKLSDPNETTASKQVYFMDNHERIQKIMGALNQVVTSITATAGEGHGIQESEAEALEQAKEIVADMKKTITDFQQTLTIAADVSEEDVATKPLTQETMKEAATADKGVQQMLENVEAAKNTKAFPYNYALLCDGIINLLGCKTKDELTTAINNIVDKGNYKSISLYELSASAVPLKKKTILSV